MKRLQSGAPSGFEEGSSSGQDCQSPLSEGDFFIIKPGELQAAPQHLKTFMREGLYDVVHEHRKPWYDRHDLLLRQITLNDHSTDHVDQVTHMAVQIGKAFPKKITSEQLEAVAVGGMVHDVAFMHAARAWGEHILRDMERGVITPKSGLPIDEFRKRVKSLLEGLDYLELDAPELAAQQWESVPPPTHPDLGKKELDPHTHHGMAVLNQWLESPSFGGHFQHWDDERRRISKFTVLHHSNGSDYTPAQVELPVKLVRMTDKLHNTKIRSQHLLNENTLHDERNVHQFVPAAINDLSVIMNKNRKELRIVYYVDPNNVESAVRQWDASFRYDRDRFIEEHERAYGTKSMPYAAEVASSLFARKGTLHDPDARLAVQFTFPDGESVHRSYEPKLS